MDPVGVSTSALNVLPVCGLGGGVGVAELVPWRAAKNTCSLWLPEDVKTTAHFSLSVWGGECSRVGLYTRAGRELWFLLV